MKTINTATPENPGPAELWCDVGRDGEKQSQDYRNKCHRVGTGLEPSLAGDIPSGPKKGRDTHRHDVLRWHGVPLKHCPYPTQPFDHTSKPLVLSALCLTIPAAFSVATICLATVLPFTAPAVSFFMLLAAMMAGYLGYGSLTLLSLSVHRRLRALTGKHDEPDAVEALLLDSEGRHVVAMLIQPRLAVSLIASILATLPDIPPTVPLALGFYVGVASAGSDVADWVLRTARLSEGGA